MKLKPGDVVYHKKYEYILVVTFIFDSGVVETENESKWHGRDILSISTYFPNELYKIGVL